MMLLAARDREGLARVPGRGGPLGVLQKRRYNTCKFLTSPARREAMLDAQDAKAWPFVLLAPELTPSDSSYTWRPELFRPPTTRKSGEERSDDEPVVESEPGLCDAMEATHAAALRAWPAKTATETPGEAETPTVPPLAQISHAQLHAVPLQSVACPAVVAPPLLTSALLRNETAAELVFEALGARWLLPRRSGFSLVPCARWRELPAERYGVLLVDPPWPSRSAARAERTRLWRPAGAAARPRAAQARRASDGCLVLVWITNDVKILRFVLDELLPAWGARHIATWYWLKTDSDGGLAHGVSIRSRERKPWEPLIIGWIGDGEPPPLPPRFVLVGAPRRHSMKPTLDGVLAAHVEGFEAMRKLEGFARMPREGWHAVGDEALMFAHLGWMEERAPVHTEELPPSAPPSPPGEAAAMSLADELSAAARRASDRLAQNIQESVPWDVNTQTAQARRVPLRFEIAGATLEIAQSGVALDEPARRRAARAASCGRRRWASRYLEHAESLDGKRVLELGAGTALVSLAAAALGADAVATDIPACVAGVGAEYRRESPRARRLRGARARLGRDGARTAIWARRRLVGPRRRLRRRVPRRAGAAARRHAAGRRRPRPPRSDGLRAPRPRRQRCVPQGARRRRLCGARGRRGGRDACRLPLRALWPRRAGEARRGRWL